MVGSVDVANDEENLFVTLRTLGGWTLEETHMAAAASDADLPVNRGGNPVPGQFPYSSRHARGTTSFTYAIPLDGLGFGEPMVVAAHAEVMLGDRKEGAWGDGADGEPFAEGGNWATWFSHELVECTSALATPDAPSTLQIGGLTLQVPAGAVSEAVQITVLSASIQDLESFGAPAETGGIQRTGQRALATETGTAFVDPMLELSDVTTIPGTVYDLGPEGLEFNPGYLPTVTVQYDEEEVQAAGFLEEDLGLFIVDGIFFSLASTVDAVSNTVSGPIPHFTMVMTGGYRKADLEMSLQATPDPVAVGEDLVYEMTIQNNGPTDITTVTASLVVEGTVDIKSPSQEGCTDLSETSPPKRLLVDCPVGDLDSGGSRTLTLVVVPQVEGETLTSTAVVDDFEGAIDPDDSNDQASESTLVQTQPTGDPDLVPISASFTSPSADVLSHEIVIKNVGNGIADLDQMTVMTWFSEDQTLDASLDDISCGLMFSAQTLIPGETVTGTFNCRISGQSGAYLLYQVDRSDRVSESDETNNVLALPYGG